MSFFYFYLISTNVIILLFGPYSNEKEHKKGIGNQNSRLRGKWTEARAVFRAASAASPQKRGVQAAFTARARR
ncbi:MAG: hypothetical protein GX417_08200 [Clostridiales bacterium]|nr:hypothetical protein [Clostridiales bacterium]